MIQKPGQINSYVKMLKRPWSNTTDIYIYTEYPDGSVEPVSMIPGETTKRYGPGEAIDCPPTISLNENTLEELSRVLAEKYPPKREVFIEGKMVATEKHLEDMRKLVFKDLK